MYINTFMWTRMTQLAKWQSTASMNYMNSTHTNCPDGHLPKLSAHYPTT